MLHVITTCPDAPSARQIADQALRQRLAACAQITPGVLSLFHWQGDIDEAPEVRLLFKTSHDRRPALVDLILAAHPYDLPVIAWHPVETTGAATEWLLAETR